MIFAASRNRSGEPPLKKEEDRLKPVTQEGHRLKSVVRVLASFSSHAREPRADGARQNTANARDI